MNAISVILALAAAAAIAIAAVYALALAWRRALLDDALLPIFGVLDRRHRTLEQLDDMGGCDALVVAVRRCALCGEKAACSRSLARDGTPVPGCPNAAYFKAIG